MSLATHDRFIGASAKAVPARSGPRAMWHHAFRSLQIVNKGREAFYAIVIYGGLAIALIATKVVHALHMINALPPLAQ